MGVGAGFGKAILFNEHFVVYGLPAIASAINAKTTALVERRSGSGVELIDNRPKRKGTSPGKPTSRKSLWT